MKTAQISFAQLNIFGFATVLRIIQLLQINLNARSREIERSRESEEYGGIASNSQKPLDEAFGLCFDFNSEFLYFNNNNPSFVISLNDLSKCLNVLFIKQKKLFWVNIPFASYKAFLVISVEPFKLQAKS